MCSHLRRKFEMKKGTTDEDILATGFLWASVFLNKVYSKKKNAEKPREKRIKITKTGNRWRPRMKSSLQIINNANITRYMSCSVNPRPGAKLRVNKAQESPLSWQEFCTLFHFGYLHISHLWLDHNFLKSKDYCLIYIYIPCYA